MREKWNTVHEAVQHYMSERRTARTAFSTKQAVKAVRETCPEAEHTDGELAQIITAAAVRSGCSILFDARKLADGSA